MEGVFERDIPDEGFYCSECFERFKPTSYPHKNIYYVSEWTEPTQDICIKCFGKMVNREQQDKCPHQDCVVISYFWNGKTKNN